MSLHATPSVLPNAMDGVSVPGKIERPPGDAIARALERARFLGEDVILVWEGHAPQTDPLIWLDLESAYPAFYWKGRHGQVEYAGVRAALALGGMGSNSMVETCVQADRTLDQRVICPPVPRDLGPRFFGGFAFDPDRSSGPLWSGFGDAALVFPEALLIRSSGQNHLMLALAVRPDQSTGEVLLSAERVSDSYISGQTLHTTPLTSRRVEKAFRVHSRRADKSVRPTNELDLGRPDTPVRPFSTLPPITGSLESGVSQSAWSAAIQTALDRIKSGSLNKVVVSRRLWLRNTRARAWPVMQCLRDRVPSCYHFGFDLGGGRSFVGASPERLFYRGAGEVETECIAGTITRGSDRDSDQSLAERLLSNPKERLEHYYVVEDMLRCLGDICERLDLGASPHVLKLATLQHLLTRARGQLKAGTTTGDILESLHPTAAVGGSPRGAALAAIRELEPDSRGWYAGPVGWYARDEAEFAVAIRSALLAENEVCVFAGSGIVLGSTPEEEWQETENKAQAFLKALQ